MGCTNMPIRVVSPRSRRPETESPSSGEASAHCRHGRAGWSIVVVSGVGEMFGSALPASRSQGSLCLTSLVNLIVLVVATLFITPTYAVEIPFENCLRENYKSHLPTPLQWKPLYLDARFDTVDPSHNLKVVTWGNVTGSWSQVELPPAGSPHWDNPLQIDGKIVREPDAGSPNSKVTTLHSKVDFLTYAPWNQPSDFCRDSLINATCPLSPVFSTTGM
jgi:hypothetical protein